MPDLDKIVSLVKQHGFDCFIDQHNKVVMTVDEIHENEVMPVYVTVISAEQAMQVINNSEAIPDEYYTGEHTQ